MKPIAIQPYFKIRREVSSIEQRDIEEQRNLYLYDDKIITEHREFPMEQVLDVSYREFGKKGGLLYLHTLKGVFSYQVKSTPKSFIDAFNANDRKL